MEIKTKFEIGQLVYAVSNSILTVKETCEVCSGKGRIDLKGKDYLCPECHGNRMITKTRPEAYRIQYHSQVGKITVEVQDDQYKETYMLKATGVGSGTLWDSENLFASNQEAEEYCREMNKKVGLEDEEVDAISLTRLELTYEDRELW